MPNFTNFLLDDVIISFKLFRFPNHLFLEFKFFIHEEGEGQVVLRLFIGNLIIVFGK